MTIIVIFYGSRILLDKLNLGDCLRLRLFNWDALMRRKYGGFLWGTSRCSTVVTYAAYVTMRLAFYINKFIS